MNELTVLRHNETHRQFKRPREVVYDARQTGYYKDMRAHAVFEGQSHVEDQMTGLGHIEGNIRGDIIGYFARIEMRNGYKATLYLPITEIGKGNPEDCVLAELIKSKGLQINQGELNEQPDCSY